MKNDAQVSHLKRIVRLQVPDDATTPEQVAEALGWNEKWTEIALSVSPTEGEHLIGIFAPTLGAILVLVEESGPVGHRADWWKPVLSGEDSAVEGATPKERLLEVLELSKAA